MLADTRAGGCASRYILKQRNMRNVKRKKRDRRFLLFPTPAPKPPFIRQGSSSIFNSVHHRTTDRPGPRLPAVRKAFGYNQEKQFRERERLRGKRDRSASFHSFPEAHVKTFRGSLLVERAENLRRIDASPARNSFRKVFK